MVPLYLVLVFFFGLTVMQVSPAELSPINMATAIGGLAVFAFCAVLLIKIVLMLQDLSGY